MSPNEGVDGSDRVTTDDASTVLAVVRLFDSCANRQSWYVPLAPAILTRMDDLEAVKPLPELWRQPLVCCRLVGK